jgi:hypothetical protein
MGKANEWRAAAQASADIVDLTLPSGMVIQARRPDPAQLAVWGILPTSLVGAAGSEPRPSGSEDATDRMTAIRDLFAWCCVSPRISLTPAGDNEIHPREVPEADWLFIVRWALRTVEASALESFRTERRHAGDRGDRENVDGPAERTYVPDGPGDRT